MRYPIKDKQTTHQTNNYANSYTKFILELLLILIFISKSSSELSLNNLKATNLLNGDIFIISESDVSVYDSTLTIKKSELTLESSMQVSTVEDLSKTTISIFPINDGGYVICIIKNYVYFFHENGTFLHQINTTSDLEGEYYSLVPFKKENSDYYYVVAFGTGESIKNCYIRLIYYKFNIDTLLNEKIYDKTVTYYDNDSTALLQTISLSCELMATSTENVLTCFFVPDINPITIHTSSYRPDSNFSLIEEFNLGAPEVYNGKYIKSAVTSDKKTALVCFFTSISEGIYCNAYNIDSKNFTWGLLYSDICVEKIYKNHVYFYYDTNQFLVSCPNYMGKVQITIFDLNFDVLYNKTIYESCSSIDGYSIVYSNSNSSYIILSDLGYCSNDDDSKSQLCLNFNVAKSKEQEEKNETKELKEEENETEEKEEENEAKEQEQVEENETEVIKQNDSESGKEIIDPSNITNYCTKKEICIINFDLSDNIDLAVKQVENIIKNLSFIDSTIIIYNNNKIYSISESDNQVISQNLSSIDLGDCETILKKTYSINSNDPLLILK